MVKKTKNQNAPSPVRSADFWAYTTIIFFPFAMLGALSFGFSATAAFLIGMFSSLAALVANAICEKSLWMFDPKWHAHFQEPDFSFRLAIVTGAILLILQTSLLVFIFTEPTADRSMLRLVFERQCMEQRYGFSEFCRGLEKALMSQP